MKYLSRLLEKIEYSSVISRGGMGSLASAKISSVCCDSRLAGIDSLFVCVKGAQFDGHDFAHSAYARGARVFVAEKMISLPDDATLIIVRDSRVALAELSATFHSHPEDKLTLVGITGTKGKTTCALMLYGVLSACGIRTAYVGTNGVMFGGRSYETKNTTPESVELYRYLHEMVAADVTHVVMEVSSQAIYMNRIHGLRFEHVIYTNLYPDHIGEGEHPSFEHYRNSKRKLLTDFGAKTVIYNRDDAHAEYMTQGVKSALISCSLDQRADLSASDMQALKSGGQLCTSFVLTCDGEKYPVTLSMAGDFNVSNALLAIASARELGIDITQIIDAIRDVKAAGRLQSVDCPHPATVVIDYAHNGASLESVLKTLREYASGRLICLFGSVGARTKLRRAELARAAGELADFSVVTSDNPDTEAPEDIISEICAELSKHTDAYISEPDRRTAIIKALDMAREGDIVLLAGKGHESYQLIDGKRVPFSEERIVKELFESADILH